MLHLFKFRSNASISNFFAWFFKKKKSICFVADADASTASAIGAFDQELFCLSFSYSHFPLVNYYVYFFSALKFKSVIVLKNQNCVIRDNIFFLFWFFPPCLLFSEYFRIKFSILLTVSMCTNQVI